MIFIYQSEQKREGICDPHNLAELSAIKDAQRRRQPRRTSRPDADDSRPQRRRACPCRISCSPLPTT
jgi:hypothetical protein